MNKSINRGDIYFCNLDPVVGSVQGGIRPVLIIQNNSGNDNSSTLIVAVLTTSIKKINLPTHIFLGNSYGLPENSMILFEQLRTIDRCQLIHYIGTISDSPTLSKINSALTISLGLQKEKGLSNNITKQYLCHSCKAKLLNKNKIIIRSNVFDKRKKNL